VSRVEANLVDAKYCVVNRPRAIASPGDDELVLPLRHKRIEFRHTNARLAVAAPLSEASLIQVAMPAQASSIPFTVLINPSSRASGKHCTMLPTADGQWRRLRSAPPSSATCSPRNNTSIRVMQRWVPSSPSWASSRRHGYTAAPVAQPPSSWTRCRWTLNLPSWPCIHQRHALPPTSSSSTQHIPQVGQPLHGMW
jgi:hypothetical protein